MDKLKSRKFWLSLAAMLAGIGTALAGYAGGSAAVCTVGTVCTALSAGIYALAEALVDASAAEGYSVAVLAADGEDGGEAVLAADEDSGEEAEDDD